MPWSHPITAKWPARHPERLQLYSLPTPNGVKVSIALEELALPYEAHKVSFDSNDQFSPEFLALNPNNKIPAILDPQGPGGVPLTLWESGAILIYLAEKTGQLLPADPAARYQALQWLMWQMGGLGPMLGQLGFFHKFAGKDFEDKRPRDRYVAESKRLLGVLNKHLAGRDWTTAWPTSPSSPGFATWWVFTRPASWSAGAATPKCSGCCSNFWRVRQYSAV
jgi:GST-like protein